MERHVAVGEVLHPLVPLPGDHHDVAGPGLVECAPDGLATVQDDRVGLGVGSRCHLLRDRLRVLGVGVVRGDDAHVGQSGGDLAHEGPLGAVPVAGRPVDAQHPAGRVVGGRRHGASRHLEHRSETHVGVRVVHDDLERRAAADPLEPPRHLRHVPDGSRQGLRLGAGLEGQGSGARDVEDVVGAEQGRVQGHHSPGVPQVEPGAGPLRGGPLHVVVRLGNATEGLHAGDLGGQAPAPLVLGVGQLGALRPDEQLALGPEVLLHGAVQVEVVPREVGEDRPRKPGAAHPLQRDAVRGDLHDDRARPGVPHPRQGLLDLRRLGRGVAGDLVLAGDDDLRGGAETARPLAEQAGEDRVEHVGGRGLAVRPRDAVDLERLRRVVEHRPGERGERGTRVRHDRHRRVRHVALGDHQAGATAERLRDEVDPVEPEARHRDEGEPGPDGAGVVRHAGQRRDGVGHVHPEDSPQLGTVRFHRRRVASSRGGPTRDDNPRERVGQTRLKAASRAPTVGPQEPPREALRFAPIPRKDPAMTAAMIVRTRSR